MVVQLIVPPLAVVSKPALVGVVEALAAGGADAVASPLVFIIGSHITDRGVQPDRVVLDLDPVQLGLKDAGSVIFEPRQVGHSAFRVPFNDSIHA